MQPEQIKQIKEQIIQQIESSFPEDKKQSAIQQIKSMNPEQFKEFLIQNKIIQNTNFSQTQQCIFCSIIEEKIKSYKLDKNKDAVAVLEINPISKAHSIIIPKKHLSSSTEIPSSAFTLAKKIAKKIKTKFKPKDIAISSANIFGHEIINILPIYENENLGSERKQAKPEELKELQNQLEKKQKPETIKKPKAKKIKEENIRLPKRIP